MTLPFPESPVPGAGRSLALGASRSLEVRVTHSPCPSQRPSPRFPAHTNQQWSRYQREFGFVLRGRAVVVDDVRVRCVGQSSATAAFNVTLASIHSPYGLMATTLRPISSQEDTRCRPYSRMSRY